MVRLVVDDDDIPLLAQFVADAVDHLVRRFGEGSGAEDSLGQAARID